nr:hypothetical protein [uncultured Roseateles sp.]
MPKPIDRLSQLQGLTARFVAAATERDWLALAHLDGELAAQLRDWTDTATWKAGERQALKQLRQIHADTRGLVDAELGQVALLLRRLTDNQGRWTAYAASADWEERT